MATTLDVDTPHPWRLALSLTVVVLLVLGWLVPIPASGHYGPGGGGLSVTIAETNGPVAAGDPLEVTISVTNDENETHTERITLSVGADIRDSESVTLEPGETRTLTLTWETTEGDAGNYVAVAEGRADSDATDVRVQTPARFTVNVTGTNAPVNATGVLEVEAAVRNTGEAPGTQEISLVVGGTDRDTIQVQLGGGERVSVTLTWSTQRGDAGTYDASLRSPDDTATAPIQITEAPAEPVNRPPNASIEMNRSVSGLQPGESVVFEALASDPDGSIDTYEWRIDGRVVSTEEAFSHTFREPGEHQVRLVVTDDDGTPTTVSSTVVVIAPTTTSSQTSSGDAGPGFGLGTAALAAGGLLLWGWHTSRGDR